MNLYNNIPENFFSILASPNKKLYVKSLFVLMDIFKHKLQIEKSEFISILNSELEEDIRSADFYDENLFDTEKSSLTGKASFIVRKLKSEKWIIIETTMNFLEYITIPDYSMKTIKLLYELANPIEQENFSLVFSTYSSLNMADRDNDINAMYHTLCDSAKRTEELVDSLKSAFHNIAKYNKQLLENISLNNILSQHYNDYQLEITEKVLKPLKIKDSVPKYRYYIKEILEKWYSDSAIIDRLSEYSQESHEDIIRKIIYIIDTYDTLEREYIRKIDRRHAQYTRATTQKIEYILNSDKSVKGDIISIMKYLADKNTDSETFGLIENSFELYRQEYIDEESITYRKNPTRHKITSYVEIEDNAEPDTATKTEILQIIKNEYSRQRVIEFVDNLLVGKNSVSARDIVFDSDKKYALIIYAMTYANDKNVNYSIKYSESSVKNGLYEIPDITIERKLEK